MGSASYDVGSAFISVIPSFQGASTAIARQAEEWGNDAGEVFAETFKSIVNAELKDMNAVKIDADTSEASVKAQALRAEIDNLNAMVDLGLDETDTQEKLALLQGELAALELEHPEILIGVDTGDAEAKLGAFDADVVASTAATDALEESTGGAGGGLSMIGSSALASAGEISPMVVGMVALGAALVPIGGLALGAFAAIPALVAGAGTAVGALYLGFSGITGAISAESAARNPDATTAQITAATRALAGLTPAGQDFVKFVTGQLFPVFDGLKDKVQAAFLPLIQTGLTDLMPFFKDLGPLIIVAAKGIGGTFDELAKFIGSKTGLSEIMQIFKLGNDFMSAMGGNVVTLFEAFTGVGAQAGPIVKGLSGGITDMVNAFAKWVKDGGFQNFLAWVKTNGPSIVNDIKDLVVGVGKFFVAVTPIGLILDKIVGYFGDFVGWLVKSDPLFLPVAAGLAAIAIAVAAISSPVVLVVGGVALLVLGITELATHWQEVWTNIKNWADDAWQFIDTHLFQPIGDFFTKTIPSAFDDFVNFCKKLPDRALAALGDFAKYVWSGLVIDATWLDTHIWQPISSFFTGLPDKIGHAAEHMWDGIKAAFVTILDALIGYWNDLHFTLPSIDILGHHIGGGTVGVPAIPLIPIPSYHTGGLVSGTPGVEQLALLMPGEIVSPAHMALPSSLGGSTIVNLNQTIYGLDLTNKQMVESVVTDSFAQFANDIQAPRAA